VINLLTCKPGSPSIPGSPLSPLRPGGPIGPFKPGIPKYERKHLM